MSIDLSKVQLATTYNSYKNDGFNYTGSINFPTSLLANQLSLTTTTVSLGEFPQFSKFFAFYNTANDAIAGRSNPQWYDANSSGQFQVGIHVSSPPAQVGWISCGIYPVILGQSILVTAAVQNPYSVNITLDPLNVPYSFIEYTLAN